MRTLHNAIIGLLIVPALGALNGCGNYDITINDRMVYEAPTLIHVDGIDDPALEACLVQQVKDQQITAIEAVAALNCSSAGIGSLGGLAQFTGLQQLKLSDNHIRNLVELSQLKHLEALWLDNNDVIDPVPVLGLSALRTVDLSGNPKMQCPKPSAVAAAVSITLPEHCRTP